MTFLLFSLPASLLIRKHEASPNQGVWRRNQCDCYQEAEEYFVDWCCVPVVQETRSLANCWGECARHRSALVLGRTLAEDSGFVESTGFEIDFHDSSFSDLSKNNISVVSEDNFKGQQNLLELNLAKNKMDHIPSGVFKYLTVSRTNVPELHANSFPPTSRHRISRR